MDEVEAPDGIVDRAFADDGTEIVLHHRDGVWQIRVDGRELMDSRHARTERALAHLACRSRPPSGAPSVLIGGLGMGFTLRAALDRLPAAAVVTVIEAFPAVTAWNRTCLGELAGSPLADRRVTVADGDVRRWIEGASDAFDVVLLDVDNGPADLSLPGNGWLYGPEGAAHLRRALVPGGVLGVWSAAPAPALAAALRAAGMAVRAHTLRAAPPDGRVRHTVVVGVRMD